MRDLGNTFELDDDTYEADAKDTATSSNSSRVDVHYGVIFLVEIPADSHLNALISVHFRCDYTCRTLYMYVATVLVVALVLILTARHRGEGRRG